MTTNVQGPKERVRLGVWARTCGLLGICGAALVASLLVGPGGYDLATVVHVLWQVCEGGTPTDPLAHAIVWELRVPRTLLVAMVGATTSVAGVVAQGLFRNPLAEPSLLGVSAGASLAVVVGFALGLDERALWATPLLAAVGSTGVLIALFALSGARAGLSTLLLVGVAQSAILGAATTVVLSLSFNSWDMVQKSLSWLLGSFDGRGWSHVAFGLGPWVVGLALAGALHRGLDVLALGVETAQTLGLEPTKVRGQAVSCIALLVGTSTALVGAIGFVGLIVPHVARLLGARQHARLLVWSAIGGAALLVLVDLGSRALAPHYVAPGALTSLIGGVFFLGLLGRRRRSLA